MNDDDSRRKSSAVRLLYLSHRVPFPPNKGDKIRSFHEIRHFSKQHEIDLLSFCDDSKEVAYVEDLRKYCRSVTLIPLPRRRQQAQAFLYMLTGEPWTLGYFSHPKMWAAVRERLNTPRYDSIFVFSSSMAPYVASVTEIPKFLDFVDSDASKWLQYARFKSAPASWLYTYEGKKLARFEQQMVRAFDASAFVSAREARHVLDAGCREKVHFVQNGIDLNYFAGLRAAESPNTIIFTGVMDYFPNVDAVSFFAREVFPLVRSACPDAQFLIVGSRPTPDVVRLGDLPGVTVTGTVPDIRLYLAKSKVAVVPVRISQGIQNKILEALAAGLPVVTTSAAAQGLNSTSDFPLAVADDPRTYAQRVEAFLRSSLTDEQVAAARRRLKLDFDWETNLSAFDRMLEPRVPALAASSAE